MQPLRRPEPTPRPEVVPQPVGPRPRGPRKLLFAVAFMAVLGGALYAFRNQLAPALTGGGGGGAAVVVKTAPVTRGVLEKSIRLAGTTVAERSASIIAPQLGGSRGAGGNTQVASFGGGGRGGMTVTISAGGGGGALVGMSGGMSDFMQVLQKAVEPGTMVRKGDIVAEFDRQYQERRLDDYYSSVEQDETNLRKVEAELEVTRKSREINIEQARATVEKAKLDLKTTPVRSQIQAELLRLQLEEAEARHQRLLAEVKFQQISEQAHRRSTELGLKDTRIELERAQRNIGRMVVEAPIDGMAVLQQTFRAGEMSQIKVGDQVMSGQMFMRIVDPASMIVAASINQADVGLLRAGARARLRFDAFPGLELPGHVISIGAMTKAGGQRADYVKEIPVIIKVDQADPRIIPDLSASADVVIAEARDELIVPLESVHRDGLEAAPYVFVRTGAGFEKRTVEIGLKTNVKAAVKSGLKEGESVAAERPPEKKPGSGKVPVAALRRVVIPGVHYVDRC